MQEKIKTIRNNFKLVFLFFLGIFCIFVFYILSCENKEGLLKVDFLDVGQGDAALITSPVGNKLLIDGGPDRSILSALGRSLPFYDRSIDAVLFSHPDKDHIGGLTEVLKTYKVSMLLYNGQNTDSPTENEIFDDADKRKIDIEIIKEGELIDLGGGVLIKILYPSKISGIETNENSVVAKLYYGDSSFVFTGDAPVSVENYLGLRYGEGLKSDVLKVAHHGSKNSLSESFLSAVFPTYSIISAGLNNRYGHPHQEILDFLSLLKSRVLKTFESGDVEFTSDGEKINVI